MRLWVLLAICVTSACGRSTPLEGLRGANDEADGGAQRRDAEMIGVDVPLGFDRPIGVDRPMIGVDVPQGCPFDCGRLSDGCVQGFCNAARGQCETRPAPEGLRCDDGNACTARDQCRGGVCVPSERVTCPDPTQCQSSSCDPSVGCVVQNRRDGARCEDGQMCTTNEICLGGMCTGGNQGGACASAIDVPLIVGRSRVESPIGFCGVDEVVPPCGPGSGPDTVFVLNNDGPRHIGVVGTNSNLHTMVVQTECGNPRSVLSCTFPAVQPGGNGGFRDRGPLFVTIDRGMTASAAPVGVEVTVDLHDTCAAPIELTLPPPGQSIEVRGITTGAQDDFQAPCAGNTASPDHVYRLEVTTPSVVELRMVPPMGAQPYDAALFILSGGCRAGPAMPLACDDDSAGDQQPLIEAVLPPGTYFVVVDGFGQGSSGEYLLRVTQRPQTLVLPFPETGDARLEQQMGLLSQDGDFVEGARRPPIGSVGSAVIDAELVNQLRCDTVDMIASLNGVAIGAFSVQPGDRTIRQRLVFPPLGGPNYSIRYEVTRDVRMGCGGISLPDGISTITLGP